MSECVCVFTREYVLYGVDILVTTVVSIITYFFFCFLE